MEEKIAISNNLKALRLKAGLRQKDVAKKLGLKCEDRISHWERGTAMPSVKNLMRLRRIYGVSMEKIFGLDSIINKHF